MNYQPAAFVAKWVRRFPNNDDFLITELDLQEFATDIADSFGVTVATVPPYVAGITYAQDFLVRYRVVGGPEAFYYSLQAGPLSAPTGYASDVNWKVVPGPVSATQLSQYITLLQAQNINGDLVVLGRAYQIELPQHAPSGHAQYLSVVGIAENWLASEGWLVVNNVRTKVKNIDYVAGTWDVEGAGPASTPRHDAYSTPASGAQAIPLLNATFVWSVGLRGVNGTLDLLSYGSGWTFANSQIQLLATANVAAQKVVELVHNGTGLGGPTTPLTVSVDAQRAATLNNLPAGSTASDYEYQFRPGPSVSGQRQVDLTNTLATGETASDYEYQVH